MGNIRIFYRFPVFEGCFPVISIKSARESTGIRKAIVQSNAPDYLREDTEMSLRETEIFLDEHSAGKRVRPILAPRFAPTCSEELLNGLGTLAGKYHCGVHTHLVESLWETQEALRLFPGYGSDAEIYERAGLMEHGPSIFAHVIFPGQEDMRILKKHDSVAVHCPDATTNIIAGIMPLARMSDEGVRIAVGSFEKGYLFNALVIDAMEDPWMELSAEERMERFCYIGDDRNIKARFIEGREVHIS